MYPIISHWFVVNLTGGPESKLGVQPFKPLTMQNFVANK